MMLETMSSLISQWPSPRQCSHGARSSMAREWDLNYQMQGPQSVGPRTIF